MIQSTFSFKGTMELHVVQGHQTVAGYVDMLHCASLLTEDPHLCDNDRAFQQDNAAVHCTCLMKNFFQGNNIALFDHPVSSPDLNPNQNVTGCMAGEVYKN